MTSEVWHYVNNGHSHTVNSVRWTPLELAQVSILEISVLGPVYKERGYGYPCARVTLARGLPYHQGQLYQLYWCVLSCVTFFVMSKTWKLIKLERLWENTLNSWKNGKILSPYSENVYNLAQKLDNSIQIVKITDHAWWRKVVLGRRVTPSRVFTGQVG